MALAAPCAFQREPDTEAGVPLGAWRRLSLHRRLKADPGTSLPLPPLLAGGRAASTWPTQQLSRPSGAQRANLNTE